MQTPKKRGFSLVEVAIALGIVSFVIISLLGLIGMGLNSGKLAAEDTTLAAIAKAVLTDLKTNSYSSLDGYSTTRYFDYGGTETNSANAHFECRIEVGSLASSPDLPSWIRDPGRSLKARFIFITPPGTTNTNEILETAIANY